MLRIKKSYLLLEIVIAFTLFASCAIPLIQQPFRLLQKEKKMIEEIEIERLASLAFAETYLKLSRQEWSWAELERSKENPILISEIKERINFTKELKIESEYSI